MDNKKPYKTKIERDIKLHEDIKVSGLQGGKVLGENLAIFSFVMGLPLLFIGLYALYSMAFNQGFPMNDATVILVLIVLSLGFLFTLGGFLIYKYK